jgi:hypothetical protein
MKMDRSVLLLPQAEISSSCEACKRHGEDCEGEMESIRILSSFTPMMILESRALGSVRSVKAIVCASSLFVWPSAPVEPLNVL